MANTTSDNTMDMSYSFFSAPESESGYDTTPRAGYNPSESASKHERSTGMENADDNSMEYGINCHHNNNTAGWPSSVTLSDNNGSSIPTQVDIWIPDSSYGYFSCPSFHPEPVIDGTEMTTRLCRVENISENIFQGQTGDAFDCGNKNNTGMTKQKKIFCNLVPFP